MKKLNVKKLNQFFMSSGNSPEVKKMVETAVENYTFAETKNPVCIRLLQDFGLLLEVTE